MKVRFIAAFDYHPTPRVTIAYRPGPDAVTVKRECGEEAVRQGRAVEIKQEADQAGASQNDGSTSE